MIDFVFWLLAIPTLLVLLSVGPVLAANIWFYRRSGGGAVFFKGLTLIKPLKGKDFHLLENLQSHVEFKPAGPYQILVALESQEDPAYETAKQFKEKNAAEDIEIVITGPSGKRMGKIHNMIEAYKRAKYDVIAFSDGDVRVDEGTFPEALAALSKGDAAFLPPYYVNPVDLGSAVLACYTNYFYVPGLALMELVGRVEFCSGGFMLFKREALEAVGGLEPFANRISDDAAIGQALFKSGRRIRVVPHFLHMPCEPKTLSQALSHMQRWGVMVKAFLGPVYYLMGGAFAGFYSLVLVLLTLFSKDYFPASVSVFSAVMSSWLASCLIQDLLAKKSLASPWVYAVSLVLNITAFFGWLRSLFGSRIEWRGKIYEVRRGGVAVVLS